MSELTSKECFVDKLFQFELACEKYYSKRARTLAERNDDKQRAQTIVLELQEMFANEPPAAAFSKRIGYGTHGDDGLLILFASRSDRDAALEQLRAPVVGASGVAELKANADRLGVIVEPIARACAHDTPRLGKRDDCIVCAGDTANRSRRTSRQCASTINGALSLRR